MKTVIAALDRDAPDLTVIRQAGELIRSGGLVAFPTETVYGLGGDALNPEAAKKIYNAKGRPSDNPLIVHIADPAGLDFIARDIPENARETVNRLWPGPLTIILPKKEIVPKETTGGLDTVAVRFPANKIAALFIQAAGGFVAAPSANRSGRPSPTRAAHVAEDLDGKIDMILDGGDTAIGLESTIVDFTADPPVILRPGYYDAETIANIAGSVVYRRSLTHVEDDQAPKAPGMKYRHYAPKGEMFLMEGSPESVARYVNRMLREQTKTGKRVAVICAKEHAAAYRGGIVISPGSLTNEEEIAGNLFDALRQADTSGADVIYSETFYTERLGEAVMNRLFKAAGGSVIRVM